MNNSIILGNRHPASQLLILVGIALLSVSVFSFIPLLLAQPLFGISALGNSTLFSETSNPQVLHLLKFMQLMQSLGLFVLPPLIFAFIYTRNIPLYLQLNKSSNTFNIPIMIVLMLFAIPAINWMGELNAKLDLPPAFDGIESWMKNMEKEAEALTTTFLKMNSLQSLFFNLLLIAVVPAFGEEFLFRGALQRIFSELTANKHLGIWISAVLFSALHLQFYGFVPRMLLGALFGYALLWTGSMWVPIVGHFVNNGTAVLISYFEQRGKISASVETIGSTSDQLVLVLVSFVGLALLLYWMFKNRVLDLPKNESSLSQ